MLRGEALAGRLRDQFDWPLFLCAAMIAVLGVVNLYSASSVYTNVIAGQYISQIYWLVLGGILGALVVAIDYRTFERLGYPIYIVGVILTILVFLLGPDTRGAARWIPIGSFKFQPSEFMKIALIVVLAKYFHADVRADKRSLLDYWQPAVLVAVPTLLVFRQPDLGTSLILALIFISIVLMTRIRRRSLLWAATLGTGATLAVWEYGLRDYQKNRIVTFLNPEENILDIGWHAHHARVALGNGGLTGHGYQRGMQNKYLFLPDQTTDFPFAVFGEEWGFLGTVVLISLYAFLVLWSIRVAAMSRDRFGAVLAVGCGAMIFWHSVFNIGMVCGVLPVVGVTLPLFSYGGSSVTATLLAIALLLNVSMRRNVSGPSGARL